MTITLMPNGQYVDIAAGTPPDVVARIKQTYLHAPAPVAAPANQGSAIAPVTPQSSSDKYAEGYRQNLNNGFGQNVPVLGSLLKGAEAIAHEGSFHLSDQVEAAAEAALPLSGVKADPSLSWNDRRKALLQGIREHNQDNAASPNVLDQAAVGAGGLFGILRAPIPFGPLTGGVAKEGALTAEAGLKGLGARVPGQAASGLVDAGGAAARRIAAKVAPVMGGAIGQGAIAGAGQAGITSLIDNGDPVNAAQAALGGATAGGIGGAVLGKLLPGVVHAFTDRNAGSAERVAYDKIAKILGRSADDTGAVYNPASATAEIADATKAGTPTVLGDLSPELRNLRGALAARTTLPSATDAATAAEQRLGSAGDRFNDQLKGLVQPATGQDALTLKANVNTVRKSQAAIDYAPGGQMDQPLAPTPALLKAINQPTSYLSRAIADAKDVVSNDPALPKWGTPITVGGKVMEMPTLRSFDAIKKSMDDQIQSGIQHLPDGSTIATNPSRIASLQLRSLKDMVTESNPEYGQILSRQRDAYEQLESVNAGKDFIKGMRTSPREVLANLQTVGAKKPEEVRTGLVDALLSLRNTSSNPVGIVRGWERNPDQRAVLEHVMGGPQQLNEFSKFMRREVRAQQGDASVLKGAKAPILSDLPEHDDTNDVRRTAGEVIRGQGYGGPLGGISAATRAITRLKTGMSAPAQDAMLRQLGGTGQGLEQGVEAAKAFRQARMAKALERARKAGQYGGAFAAAINGSGN